MTPSLLNRRSLLASVGAAAVVAGLPAVANVPAVPAKAVKPPVPTWIVGTPGEADHEVIRAATREAAILLRAEACEDDDDPDQPGCECCACTDRDGYQATRVASWDGRPQESIGDADWLQAGFDTTCSRCGYEASREAGDQIVSGKVVCCCCMKLADWEIVDLERAAEMRAEAPPTPTLLAPSVEQGALI